MDRKQFLTVLASGCACCGAALALGEASAFAAEPTECDNKFQFAQTWVSRMLNQLDKQLDAPTRTKIMDAMGRECFQSFQGKNPPKSVAALMEGFAKYQGPDSIRRDGNIVQLKYKPGDKPGTDGCLCPMAEKTPANWPGSFCDCSVGYVKAMFEAASGGPAKVELVEALKRGGKQCAFKVELSKG